MRFILICATLLTGFALNFWQATEKGTPMRIHLERFSFDSPAGFEDSTNYTFKDSAKRELLTVSFGTRPPEADDLFSLLAIRRDNAEMVLAGKIHMEAEAEARIDGIAARMLSFTFEDSGIVYRERMAVSLPMPETYLQISYIAPTSVAKAQGRFEHILHSVVPAKRSPTNTTPTDYIRRWAKQMTLDVPRTLSAPRSIQFSSTTDHSTLGFQYFDAVNAAARPSFLEREYAEASTGLDRKSESISTSLGPMDMTSYTLKTPGNEDAPTMVRKVTFTVGGVEVRAYGRGPVPSTVQLDNVFKQWINSFGPDR